MEVAVPIRFQFISCYQLLTLVRIQSYALCPAMQYTMGDTHLPALVALLNASRFGVPVGRSVKRPALASLMRAFFS